MQFLRDVGSPPNKADIEPNPTKSPVESKMNDEKLSYPKSSCFVIWSITETQPFKSPANCCVSIADNAFA